MTRGALGIALAENYMQVGLQHEIFCLKATSKGIVDLRYGTDSYFLATDNCSSRGITNSLEDFVSPPLVVNIKTGGIAGFITAAYKGTVKWSVNSDDGVKHHTWLVPDVCYRLLSPQHWAQSKDDICPRPRGTWCGTYNDGVDVFWDQRRFKRSIQLSATSNIALLRTVPEYRMFNAFHAKIADIRDKCLPEEGEHMTFPSEISDDEQSDVLKQGNYAKEFQDKVITWFDLGLDLQKAGKVVIIPDGKGDYVQYGNPQA
jgi:hypothetical protein